MVNHENQAYCTEKLELSSTILQVLRDNIPVTKQYLYNSKIWKEVFSKNIKTLKATSGLIIIKEPDLFHKDESNRILIGDNGEWHKELLNFINDNPEYNFPIKIGEIGDLVGCREEGIKEIHLIPYPGHHLTTETFLVYRIDTTGTDEVEKARQVIENSMAVIDNIIKSELEYFFGPEKLSNISEIKILNHFLKEKKKAIYMFIDIRNFTPLTEFLRERGGQKITDTSSLIYPTITQIVSSYCDRVSRDIFIFGRVDKFIGDGIMAIFGDLEDVPEEGWPAEAMKAVCTALRIQHTFKQIRKEWTDQWLHHHQREHPEEIAPSLGIGIHLGWASFNFFGPEHYKEFSAIGDAVTMASRIESQAGKNDRPNILVSQPIYCLLRDASNFKPPIYQHLGLGDEKNRFMIEFKGKSHEYPIWGIKTTPIDKCDRFIYGRDKGESCNCWR